MKNTKNVMKNTGVLRKVDELGRIVIPVEIRKIMNIKEKDHLEIFIDEDGYIKLKKYENTCTFCKNKINLQEIMGRKICKKCIKEISKISNL